MAPRTRTSGSSALDGLTEIEEVVIRAAARLLTALEYREKNPGGDFRRYLERIPIELHLVSDMFQLAERRSETPHRLQAALHPVLTIVGQLWRDAAVEGRSLKIEDISLADIRASCVTMAKKHPDKPPVFFETDLSRLAYGLPQKDHWWLPSSDEEKHSQDQFDRRKAPEATMDIDSLPVARRAPLRGNKRSAVSMVRAEERADKDDGISKTDLQTAGKAVARRVVHVVIPSSNPSLRQQRPVSNDAESTNESEEETSAKLWDRCARCKKLNLPVCEPQWQAKTPFNSCKACARQKTACVSTNIWKKKVAIHNRTWVLRQGSAQHVGGNHTPETQGNDAQQSPPKKRRRIEENAGSEGSKESDSEEAAEETSAKPWVGRGKDRCASCRSLNLPVCEPQWQSTRLFRSCKACARRKTVCKATKIWMEKVAMHQWTRQVPTQDVGGKAPGMPASKAPQNAVEGSSEGMEATGGRRRGRRLNLKPTNATPAVATNPQIIPLDDRITTAVEAHIQAMGAPIESKISDLKACIEGHSASLATLERTQQELKNMLLMLCGQQAIAVASAAGPSTSALSTSAAPAQFSTTSKAPGKIPPPAQRVGQWKTSTTFRVEKNSSLRDGHN